jgi:hypothetical protein
MYLGVQIGYNVVHLRTSLVQLFVLLELKMFGGALTVYPIASFDVPLQALPLLIGNLLRCLTFNAPES